MCLPEGLVVVERLGTKSIRPQINSYLSQFALILVNSYFICRSVRTHKIFLQSIRTHLVNSNSLWSVRSVWSICSHTEVDGKRGPGRPKMTWKQLTERDCKEWKPSIIYPHDRRTWRSGVRSAMRAASQLSGRGPTDVDFAPVPVR